MTEHTHRLTLYGHWGLAHSKALPGPLRWNRGWEGRSLCSAVERTQVGGGTEQSADCQPSAVQSLWAPGYPKGPRHKHKPRGHRKEQGPEETDLEQRTLDGARGSIPSVSASSQGPTIACSSSRPHCFHLQGKLETLVLVSGTRSSGRCKAKCPCCYRASTTPQPPGAYWVQGSSMEWGRCAAL